MSKVLVTGGAGMIGSALVQRFIENNDEVIVIDNLSRGKRQYVNSEARFYQYDLGVDNIEIEEKSVDVVVHLADVVGGVQYAHDNQYEIYQKNVFCDIAAMQLAVKLNSHQFINIGTACSFPASTQDEYEENANQMLDEYLYNGMPETSYGFAKLCSVFQTQVYVGKMKTSSLILHNVYGPNCAYDQKTSQVIPALCRKMVERPGESLIVWGSGKQVRDFIYVDDVVDAIMKAIEVQLNGVNVQICTGKPLTIYNVADALVDIAGTFYQRVLFDIEKPEGDKGRYGDPTAARQLLSWESNTTIYQGLRKTYDWIAEKMTK